MNSEVTYRWLAPDDERAWKQVEFVLEARGWMSLNRITSRVLLTERDGVMIGFFVFQLVPMVGPVWLHPAERGVGIAEEMAHQMWEFLLSNNARGWIAGAESPHSERLCELFGMVKIDHPMYITVGMERKL